MIFSQRHLDGLLSYLRLRRQNQRTIYLKQDEKTPFLILHRAQNLPSLLFLSKKHYAIDIADPSNMQDACHKNFVIDLAHRSVFVAQW